MCNLVTNISHVGVMGGSMCRFVVACEHQRLCHVTGLKILEMSYHAPPAVTLSCLNVASDFALLQALAQVSRMFSVAWRADLEWNGSCTPQ